MLTDAGRYQITVTATEDGGLEPLVSSCRVDVSVKPRERRMSFGLVKGTDAKTTKTETASFVRQQSLSSLPPKKRVIEDASVEKMESSERDPLEVLAEQLIKETIEQSTSQIKNN
ncbi:hypothetical protein Ciccas_000135 [Cichlidogyrus casuarinus]|uniref:Cadherin domain-containing protein n=1 Tax=Cichlidogyrus casuarinus TaxID=1844966 RepID=A0ABD2QP22_9PLAT